MQGEKEVLGEPVLLVAGVREVLEQQADLRARQSVVVERDEDVRRAEVAVVLRDLVLEDEVVAERVPGQLGRRAGGPGGGPSRWWVKMTSGANSRFSSSKTSLTCAAEVGEEAVAELVEHDASARRRPAEEAPPRSRVPRAARVPCALSTTQVTSSAGRALERASAACRRSRSRCRRRGSRSRARRCDRRAGEPSEPAASATTACRAGSAVDARSAHATAARRLEQALEELLVLERVHRRPEAVVAVGDELVRRDQALRNGSSTRSSPARDVVEDLAAEDEEAAIDPEVRVARRPRSP